MKVVALAGGVGAAKFLRGLLSAVPPGDLTVVVNTGDDALIHGLHISPDLDIVTYTLAGVVGDRGWGFSGDTTHALDQMREYGVPAWFSLGDRDLGTHLARTEWLSGGAALSEITDRIKSALQVESRIIPMSDDPVRTKLITEAGIERDFQEYFVKLKHSEPIREVRFEGASESRPAPGVIDAIEDADAIIICPSNPVLSIGPIFSVPGIRAAVAARRPIVYAISPIVAGAALKGPAAELLSVWQVEPTAFGVARLVADVSNIFVLDVRDALLKERIEELGIEVILQDTVMEADVVAERMAKTLLAAARTRASATLGDGPEPRS